MARRDNECGCSVADEGDGKRTTTQPQQQRRSKNSGGRSKNYRGVSYWYGMWIASVLVGMDKGGKRKGIHLGAFPTAEMAAIAFDTAVFFLSGLSGHSMALNFPRYASQLPCPLSKSYVDIRSAAWKAAKDLAPLIILEQKSQGVEVSGAISAATSAPVVSSSTGMPDPDSTSSTPAGADPGISTSSLMHGALPTLNPKSMPIEMETSGEVGQEDYVLIDHPMPGEEDYVLVDYPLGAGA